MNGRGPRQGHLTRRNLLRQGLGAAAGVALVGIAGPERRADAAPAPRRGGTLIYASSADMITLDVPYVSDTI